jgi:DNA-binding HxlR family transcriptional regulator
MTAATSFHPTARSIVLILAQRTNPLPMDETELVKELRYRDREGDASEQMAALIDLGVVKKQDVEPMSGRVPTYQLTDPSTKLISAVSRQEQEESSLVLTFGQQLIIRAIAAGQDDTSKLTAATRAIGMTEQALRETMRQLVDENLVVERSTGMMSSTPNPLYLRPAARVWLDATHAYGRSY